MYQYTEFDRAFVQARANQYRDQLSRWQAGQLPEDEFRPLRLQNGWYVQRYAPMLRVAVPYGELSSAQLRVLAKLPATMTSRSPSRCAPPRPSRTCWARCRATSMPSAPN